MPRQATLPEPTPAVPGKPITVASQVVLEDTENDTESFSHLSFLKEAIEPDEMAKLLQRNPNIAQVLEQQCSW